MKYILLHYKLEKILSVILQVNLDNLIYLIKIIQKSIILQKLLNIFSFFFILLINLFFLLLKTFYQNQKYIFYLEKLDIFHIHFQLKLLQFLLKFFSYLVKFLLH